MKKIILVLAMLFSLVSLHAQGDLHLYSVKNKDGKITAKMVEDALTNNGFFVGINADIAGGLEQMYKSNRFKVYNTISFYHKSISIDLLKDSGNAGVITPMGIAIYQTKDEDTLHIAVVTADAQAKIIGADIKILKNLELAIANVIMKLFPNALHEFSPQSLKEDRILLTQHAKELKGADWEDAKDELEEAFEERFKAAGFVMPSYFDFTDDLGENSPYDFFATYSICKIDVIKSVSEVRPEAAAFAPCTTMVYKKKDEDKIVMGFSAVYNWLSSATITDKASTDALMHGQRVFEGIIIDVTK